jgi:radical SAM superfamily enzyme YgiQ (UPF0313 family)
VQGKYRQRSPVKVVEEIEHLYEKGMRSFFFVDDSFYLDEDKAISFASEILRKRLRIAYRIQTRADVLSDEYVEALADSGCYNIALGVESGSEVVLSKMHKGNDSEITLKAIQRAKRAGIRVEALMIVGNEGETDETIEETRRFLKLARPTTVAPAKDGLFLFPGTAVYNQAIKEGQITEGIWDTRVRVPVWKYDQKQLAKWTKRIHTHRMSTGLRYYLTKVETGLRRVASGS